MFPLKFNAEVLYMDGSERPHMPLLATVVVTVCAYPRIGVY